MSLPARHLRVLEPAPLATLGDARAAARRDGVPLLIVFKREKFAHLRDEWARDNPPLVATISPAGGGSAAPPLPPSLHAQTAPAGDSSLESSGPVRDGRGLAATYRSAPQPAGHEAVGAASASPAGPGDDSSTLESGGGGAFNPADHGQAPSGAADSGHDAVDGREKTPPANPARRSPSLSGRLTAQEVADGAHVQPNEPAAAAVQPNGRLGGIGGVHGATPSNDDVMAASVAAYLAATGASDDSAWRRGRAAHEYRAAYARAHAGRERGWAADLVRDTGAPQANVSREAATFRAFEAETAVVEGRSYTHHEKALIAGKRIAKSCVPKPEQDMEAVSRARKALETSPPDATASELAAAMIAKAVEDKWLPDPDKQPVGAAAFLKAVRAVFAKRWGRVPLEQRVEALAGLEAEVEFARLDSSNPRDPADATSANASSLGSAGV